MAKLKIYGPERSRAGRCLWTAREAGVEFERVDVDRTERDGAFRKINPNGKFPAMQDGDLTLFESLAINLYIAKTYAFGSLYPSSANEEACCLQWTLFAANEVEPHLIVCLIERLMKPEGARDIAKAAAAEAACQPAFKVLEEILASRAYLLGDAFTIADLNLASCMEFGPMAQVDMSAYPKVSDWLSRCLGRPAHSG